MQGHMKQLALVALLTGAVCLPSGVAGQDQPEDPFDRRLLEMFTAMDKAAERQKAARAKWKRTGSRNDLQEYRSAILEFQSAQRRHKLSQSDYWEARNRLIEYIHDSDDSTVFELYMLARERKEKNRKLRERIDATAAGLERLSARIAARGASLTPPPKTPD